MHAYMKTKTKPTKKQTKVTSGISRTTQKTFIAAAIAVYVLVVAEMLKTYINLSMNGVEWTLRNLLPLYVIDSLIVPLVLFAFAYVIFKDSPSKISRLFKSTLVPAIAAMTSMAVGTLSMELFWTQMGYGNTAPVWYSEWLRAIPLVISLVTAVVIALFVFKRVKDKEFTASRTVQKTVIGTVALTIIANAIAWVDAIFKGSNGGYANSTEALTSFLYTAVIILVPLVILYSIASRASTKLTRLFTAVVYILIGIYISSIVLSSMSLFNIYMHEPSSFGAILYPFLGFAIWGGVVAVHKLRKVF